MAPTCSNSKTAAGETLAISVPAGETAVLADRPGRCCVIAKRKRRTYQPRVLDGRTDAPLDWAYGLYYIEDEWRSRLTGSEMRGYLKDHVGVFDPDDVVILLAAFDKAWEAVQASGVTYPADKLEFVRAILAKHIIAAAMEGERDVGRLRDSARPAGNLLANSVSGCEAND
jgi:hypothetical protein